MWFTIFLIAIAFIFAIAYNSNKSNKSFQQSNQNFEPKPFTNRDFIQFEAMIEQGFETNINNTIKRTVDVFGDNPKILGLAIISSIGSTYKALKEGSINDPQFNLVMSNEEIIRSLNKVRDKVKNKYIE